MTFPGEVSLRYAAGSTLQRPTVQSVTSFDARSPGVAFSSISLTAMQAAIGAGLGVGILARFALSADMIVLSDEHGFPPMESAQIGLLGASDANTVAVDCLADFLITHMKS